MASRERISGQRNAPGNSRLKERLDLEKGGNAVKGGEGEGAADAEKNGWVKTSRSKPPRELQIKATEIRAIEPAAALPPPPPGPRDGAAIALEGGWVAEKVDPAVLAQRMGGQATNAGHGFILKDPTGKDSFTVVSGFASAYLRKDFPETQGHDVAWFLGRPLENEHEERLPGVDEERSVQRFERGTLTWTPSQNVQLMPNRVAPRELRFRFAPSPTGHLHIGGAYVALKNFMAAQQAGGKFFLRIEDTDTVRSKDEYTKAIKEGLTWLGVKYEDDVVAQSQRGSLYKDKVQKLIAEKKAYVGEGGAVYFSMPKEGKIIVNDVLRGRVAVNVANAGGMGDFVIQRADGTPTFLLANVVDDGDQGITHVIRGVDHLANAAKQVPLFKALGYRVPDFYHVPLIHGDDAAKLSKRHGATSVIEFQREGFDPEVMVNHLARLGFGFSTNETLPLNALIEEFDPSRIGKSKAQIGYDALRARNRDHIQSMPESELARELTVRASQIEVPFDDGKVQTLAQILGSYGLEALAHASKGRASTYQEALELGMLSLSPPDMLESDVKKFATPENIAKVKVLMEKFEAIDAADFDLAHSAKAFAMADKSALPVLRWMLTGSYEGFPLETMLPILGKEETMFRLKQWTEVAQ